MYGAAEKGLRDKDSIARLPDSPQAVGGSISRTKEPRIPAGLQPVQLDLAAIDVVGEPESRHTHRHAGMDLPVDSEQLLEAVSGLSGGRADETRIELADP